jgi:retron-type reverse transcriptase
VHAVLKKIKLHWGEVSWFWNTRLVKNFNNINYHRLINELEKTIDDKRFVHEIWKMCRKKVIDLNKSIHLNLGVFDENMLSVFCAMLCHVHRLFRLI